MSSEASLKKAQEHVSQVRMETLKLCLGSIEHDYHEKIKEAYLAGYAAGFAAATTRTSPPLEQDNA